MHRSTQLLSILGLVVIVVSCLVNVGVQAIETTSLPGTPVSPSGVVCIQVVCPDPGVDDPTTCPERCNGNCNIIQNACCPQNSVAVCADEAAGATTTASNSFANQPTTTTTTTDSGAVSTPVSSSSEEVSSSSPPASSASPPPAETTDPTSSDNPEGSSNSLKLPYFVLPLFIILITKLLLP